MSETETWVRDELENLAQTRFNVDAGQFGTTFHHPRIEDVSLRACTLSFREIYEERGEGSAWLNYSQYLRVPLAAAKLQTMMVRDFANVVDSRFDVVARNGVRFDKNVQLVVFSTDEGAIEVTGKDGVERGSKVALFAADASSADVMLRALRHAALLCGAHKAAF
jgi:hypothetical protein